MSEPVVFLAQASTAQQSRITSITAGILSPEQIRQISVVNITDHKLSDKNAFKFGGLNDLRMGPCRAHFACATCGHACQGHPGRFEFSNPLYNPNFLPQTVALLSNVCYSCCQLLPRHKSTTASKLRTIQCSHCKRFQPTYMRDDSSIGILCNWTLPIERQQLTLGDARVMGLIRSPFDPLRQAHQNQQMLQQQQQQGVAAWTDISQWHRTKFFSAWHARDILLSVPAKHHATLLTQTKTTGLGKPADIILENMIVIPPPLRPCISQRIGSAQQKQNPFTVSYQIILKTAQAAQQMRQSLFETTALQQGDNNFAHKCDLLFQEYGHQDFRVLKAVDASQQAVAALYDTSLKGLTETYSGKNKREPRRCFADVIRGKKRNKNNRFRRTICSSRQDQSARSVISPDPDIDIDELSVCTAAYDKMFITEMVAQFNLEAIREAIRRGPFAIPRSSLPTTTPLNKAASRNPADIVITQVTPPGGQRSLNLKTYTKEDLERLANVVNVGWIYHRRINRDDWGLWNRQPTLHRPSIMAHRFSESSIRRNAVIISKNKASTMIERRKRRRILTHSLDLAPGSHRRSGPSSFNPAVCKPYNADFDGDEMNLHLTGSVEAQAEARFISAVENNMIAVHNGATLISTMQDSAVGLWKATSKDTFLTREEFCQYLTLAKYADLSRGLPEPAILAPKRLWTGSQLVSMLLPQVLCFKGPGKTSVVDPGDPVVILRGELLSGRLDVRVVSQLPDNLIRAVIFLKLGRNFVSDMNRVMQAFVGKLGFSVGLADLLLSERETRRKPLEIACALTDTYLRPDHERAGEICKLFNDTQFIDNPEHSDAMRVASLPTKIRRSNELEQQTRKIIQRAWVETHSQALTSSSPGGSDTAAFTGKANNESGLVSMALSGSKGGLTHIQQMRLTVGPQELGGHRPIPLQHLGANRTFPSARHGDRSSTSFCTVKQSFMEGLQPNQMFIHGAAGIQGLAQTAVQTALSGYFFRRAIKMTESQRCDCLGGLFDSESKSLIQLCYGGDRLEAVRCQLVQLPKWVFFQPSAPSTTHLPKHLACHACAHHTNVRRVVTTAQSLATIFADRFQLDKIICSLIRYQSPRQCISAIPMKHVASMIRQKCYITATTPTIVTQHHARKQRASLNEACHAIDHLCQQIRDLIGYFADALGTLLAIRAYLTPHLLVCRSGYSLDEIQHICEQLLHTVGHALVAAGEAAGMLASQSIAAPAMQIMLNSFHVAGIAGAGTSGLRHLDQLTATGKSANITQSFTTCLLTFPWSKTRHIATRLAISFGYATLQSVTQFMTSVQVSVMMRPHQQRREENESHPSLSFHWPIPSDKCGTVATTVAFTTPQQRKDVEWVIAMQYAYQCAMGLERFHHRHHENDDDDDINHLGQQTLNNTQVVFLDRQALLSHHLTPRHVAERVEHYFWHTTTTHVGSNNSINNNLHHFNNEEGDEGADWDQPHVWYAEPTMKSWFLVFYLPACSRPLSLQAPPRKVGSSTKMLAVAAATVNAITVESTATTISAPVASIIDSVRLTQLAVEYILANVAINGLAHTKVVSANVVESPSEGWAITVPGDTFPWLITHCEQLDTARSYSNNHHAMIQAFGVEAGVMGLYHELQRTIGFNSHLDQRHLMLHVHTLLYDGAPTPYTRFGMAARKRFIPLAAFEEPWEELNKAQIRGAKDDIGGITSNIVCGQLADFGTNSFDVLVHKDAAPRSTTNRIKAIRNLPPAEAWLPLPRTAAIEQEESSTIVISSNNQSSVGVTTTNSSAAVSAVRPPKTGDTRRAVGATSVTARNALIPTRQPKPIDILTTSSTTAATVSPITIPTVVIQHGAPATAAVKLKGGRKRQKITNEATAQVVSPSLEAPTFTACGATTTVATSLSSSSPSLLTQNNPNRRADTVGSYKSYKKRVTETQNVHSDWWLREGKFIEVLVAATHAPTSTNTIANPAPGEENVDNIANSPFVMLAPGAEIIERNQAPTAVALVRPPRWLFANTTRPAFVPASPPRPP